MKKLLALALVAALAFSFAACTITQTPSGPGADQSGQNNKPDKPISLPKEDIQTAVDKMSGAFSNAILAIEGGDTEKLNWPTSSFPSGFPAYPEGDVIYAESFLGDDIMVFVENTSKATYDAYLKTLEGAGWIFAEPEDGYDFAYKGSLMLTLVYEDEYGSGIYIYDMGIDLEELYTPAEWPQDLPVAIPVYPDGEVYFADVDGDMVAIGIDNTSKASFDAYMQDIISLGWVFDEAVGDLTLEVEGGEWIMFLDFDESDNSVNIGLFFMEAYDYDVDILDFTGWGNDEFSQRLPPPDFALWTESLTEATFTALFKDVTVPMIKDYAEKVAAAGFAQDAKVTEETEKTYIYTASDSEGYNVILRLYDDGTMYLTMSKFR